MLRLIHTADWQIGREYGRFDPDDARALADARLDTVKRIAALANETNADLIVVAGDVFDAPAVADKTMRRLFSALEAFAGPWVLLAGNHDPILAAGVWASAREAGCIPDNVSVPSDISTLQFDNIRTCVLTAPLTQRRVHDDLTAAFDAIKTPDDFYRIGLAHGSVAGAIQGLADAGNPIATDRPESARLDYLGLGDWHGMMQAAPRVWYSGTPEQDRFRNNNPGHVLQVSIAQPGAMPEVVPVRVGKHAWHNINATLTDSSSLDLLNEQLQALQAEDVVRLSLGGQLNLLGQQKLEDLLDVHSARFRGLRLKREDLLTAATDEDIANLNADGYVAQVLSDLRSTEPGLSRAVQDEALQILADKLMRKQSGANS